MDYPKTRRDEIVEEIFGYKIKDPYRWLEEYSDETKKWILEENDLVKSSLESEASKIFSTELVKNFKVVNFSNPYPVNGRYFYSERQPDEDQSVIYYKIGLNGSPVKLVDPNGLKENNTITVDFTSPSRTGKYLAYGISESGDEMATLYIKDVDKNENIKDSITRCRYSQVRWLPDDSGFFYTRNPRPGTVPKNEEHLHIKVYFHKLGDDMEKDELIFGEGRPKDDMVGISISLDGRYLGVHCGTKWTESDIYIYDRETKETKAVAVSIPSKFSLRFIKDKAILETNYKANNRRLLWTSFDNLYKPIDDWEEFIPERESLLLSVSVTSDKILIEYLKNVCSEVVIFDYTGNEIGKIPLPKFSSLAGISTNREEAEFFYGVDSFLFPKITYYFDPKTNNYSLFKKTDNPINPDDYEIKQEWFHSKDKTKVPMFIFHRKDIVLNGLNPTILFGYGGFNSSNSPTFMRNNVPWLERGGVFAVANIRGGGEFGEKWHKGGIKENKQNSFNDFISSAEHLISRKYTDANHLGILGGSQGGLLVSTVAIQRPDLFKAVCSRVPLTDMIRFPKFGIAIRWVHEYGNPEIKSELENILKWSPYHNVKEGVEYPNILFTTGEKDTRVDPLHARKMAAILQNTNKENEILVFTETDAGHGQGKPIAKVVETQTLVLTFFAKHLNLKI